MIFFLLLFTSMYLSLFFFINYILCFFLFFIFVSFVLTTLAIWGNLSCQDGIFIFVFVFMGLCTYFYK